MKLLSFGLLPETLWITVVCVIVALILGALLGAWLQRHADQTAVEDKLEAYADELEREQHHAVTDFRYKDDYERQYWDLDESDMKEVREKIKNYIKEKSIPQHKLATRTGVSQAHVSRMLSTSDTTIKVGSFTVGPFNAVLKTMGLKVVLISQKKEKFTPKAK